jgi:ornithine carbamoyltransferase
MKRDLLSIRDITTEEMNHLLKVAGIVKKERDQGLQRDDLKGKTLAMIFEKASTRTRISFEVGMYELGGHGLFLNSNDLQIGRGEEIRDTARVLSRYVSAVMIRANRHTTLQEFSQYASVPIINGLSDREHPCQILADLMTMQECFGELAGLRVAWIGDANNVCHSLILAASMTGIHLTLATPSRFAPDNAILSRALAEGGTIQLTDSPEEAATGADVLYTDVWVSMGDETERETRIRELKGYTIHTELLSRASPEAVVLHCLPAHRGEEITDEVLESPQSVVWQQAENRLHIQKALLLFLLGNE